MPKNKQETQLFEREQTLLSIAGKKDEIILLLEKESEGYQEKVDQLKEEIEALEKLEPYKDEAAEEKLDISQPNPNLMELDFKGSKKQQKKLAKLNYKAKKYQIENQRKSYELDHQYRKAEVAQKNRNNYTQVFITVVLAMALLGLGYMIYLGKLAAVFPFSIILTLLAGRGELKRNFKIQFSKDKEISSTVHQPSDENKK